MKIRSLLLGSIAAAGLSTAGFAADLGVVTSLDICDELGLSGLTISSDENCLVITGEVKYEFSWGDYEDDSEVDANNEITGDEVDFIAPDDVQDANSIISAWLKFVGTANSDFGPASATIKLMVDEATSDDLDELPVGLKEAYVSIGDTTTLMAGLKGSIFDDGDDAPLNWLGLFNSSMVDAGVGGNGDDDVETGGHVIQVMHNLGNGISIGAGLEDLDSDNDMSFVGVMKYAGDGITAHASFAVGELLGGAPDMWKFHAGVAGTADMIKYVGAIYADNTTSPGDTYYNALASVMVTFDMFEIAVSGEVDGDSVDQQWGVGGSLAANVMDGVKLSVGARHWVEADGDTVSQVAGGISAAVTETITATAEVGYAVESNGPDSLFYGKGSLAWAPGGGFTSSVSGEANSLGAYKATFKAAKTIK
jgi:hypothetical protein